MIPSSRMEEEFQVSEDPSQHHQFIDHHKLIYYILKLRYNGIKDFIVF